MLSPYNPTAGAGGSPLTYHQPDDEDQLAKLRQGLGGALGAQGVTQVAPPNEFGQPAKQTPAPGAPPKPVAAAAPSVAPAPTFAQMQSQGIARPAPPTPPQIPASGPAVMPGGFTQFTGAPVNDVANPLKPADDPNSPGTGGHTGGDAGGTTGGGGAGQPTTPPAPGATNPAFDPTQIPMYGQISDALKQWLANPSRYTSQTAQDTYKSLGGLIDQDYAAQGKSLNDELAKRGISDSTIAGQRYSDLGTEQARAKANLAQSIATQQAQTSGQDLQSALSSALGLGGLGVQQQALQQGGIMQTLALLSQYGLLSPDFLAKLGVSPGATH